MNKSKCLWFHRHQWDKPDGRYQSCKVCGVTVPIECAHTWEIIKEKAMQYVLGGGEVTLYTLKCSECGEIKAERSD